MERDCKNSIRRNSFIQGSSQCNRKTNSSRAVANACGKNPYPLTIPCHRVIRTDGKLGGYSGKGGIKTKEKLLKQEQK